MPELEEKGVRGGWGRDRDVVSFLFEAMMAV